MKYQAVTAVWEVTMGCNMRCGHCGSSCAEALPDELTTEEALKLCDEIADLGLRWITLSGGEPLTRRDIGKLIQRLSSKGVSVNIITNGWLLTQEKAEELKQSGITTVAISIDGTQQIHDMIRRPGAFEHAANAFRILKGLGIKTGAVTTITNQNIGILRELKEDLIRIGVDTWQVQIGLPMGNLKEKPDWLIAPEQVNDILDFCYETATEGRIRIYPADCIGYYTKKEMEIKRISYQTDMVSLWNGCNAGVRSFGILHDGKILGCTSIRSKEYIEGNIREKRLRDIWESDETFLWRRNMTKEKLSGDCKTCTYGSRCLGGCPNTRLTMNGDIYTENQYCAYNCELKKISARYDRYTDEEQLYTIVDALILQKAYQEALGAVERLLLLKPDHKNGLLAGAYAEYMCGNYERCKEKNARVLEIDAENGDAMAGYANALYRQGNREDAIQKMQSALQLRSNRKQDMYHDLLVMQRGA